jgi:isoquinoline 1-oxidoreductase beta subunit
MRGGFYRPYSISRVRAGLTADGKPLAYHQTVVGKPVLKQSPIGKPIIDKLGFDPSSFEGAANTLYGFPNLRVESHDTDEVVTNLWWRSVGNSIHGFVVNGVVDELATLAGKDGCARCCRKECRLGAATARGSSPRHRVARKLRQHRR